MLNEWLWLVIVGGFLAVFVAYGIGANDVANSFATSVGSRAITLRQCVVIAGVCEFLGAVLMGASVTSTIKDGITTTAAFARTPELLIYGMCCALLACGIWLIVATYFELPVSTTHSIVGAIIGMTMVSRGPGAVDWGRKTATGLRIRGVASIVLGWVFAPLISALLSALGFFLLRTFVLRAKNSTLRSYFVLPPLTFGTFYVIVYFICEKGGKAFDLEDLPEWEKHTCSAAVGAGFAIMTAIAMPFLAKKVKRDMHALGGKTTQQVAIEGETAVTDSDVENHRAQVEETVDERELKLKELTAMGNIIGAQKAVKAANKAAKPTKVTAKWKRYLNNGVNKDVHGVMTTDKRVGDIHLAAERFEPSTEQSFRYLQIFTAMVNSFAHGSNDVANGVGPFAAIYTTYKLGRVSSQADVPIWIYVLGGVGLVLGLATYGYKIIRALGVKVTRITNSRGFVVELSAAIITIVGSRYGLPLSTTQTLTGAVIGVGLLEGGKGLNWQLLIKFFAGWVATLVVAGLTAALFTAVGIFTPNRNCAQIL
jgi:sodium-dependent phosphate transporter